MAMSDSHDYPSVFNTNHINIPSSASASALRRCLSQSASSTQATSFDEAQGSLAALGGEVGASTLEFRVPLLSAAPSFSDFQSNATTSQTQAYTFPWAHWYENARGVAREKGALAQAPLYATVSIPLPGPTPAPISGLVSVPTVLEQADRLKMVAPLATTLTSNPEDEVMKVESPMLSLHDICHVESLGAGLDSLALPPPIFAKSSPDLLDPRLPHLENENAYSGCPSADFVAPIWNSSTSMPSLSYGSFSGSEGNPLSASSSCKKLSITELLRNSPSPPLGPWTGEQASASPPLVGLYADVNMRELALRSKSPTICVNPADVMTDSLMISSPTLDSTMESSPVLECKEESPPSPVHPMPTLGERFATPPLHRTLSPAPDYMADFPQEALVNEEFLDEAVSAIVSILKTSAVKSEVQPAPIYADAVRPAQTYITEHDTVYPHGVQTYHGNNFGMMRRPLDNLKTPGPSTQPYKRIPLADLPIPQPEYAGPPHTFYHSGAPQQATTYTFAPTPQAWTSTPTTQAPVPAPGSPLSPVLNAHTGISLEDLRRRADDFRARHEGADLDKNFLQCFAGRLSARGEMLDEYRCYVTGCEQRNKRRDHILVHVGAHVEHRPWMCRDCGMRFLRKNECKRHEAGHGGQKPFSCSLCAPYQEKSFVRQDLLKRHLRVAHGAQSTVARKKKGTVKDEDEDYWP